MENIVLKECTTKESQRDVWQLFFKEYPNGTHGIVNVDEYVEKVCQYARVIAAYFENKVIGFIAFYANDLVSKTAYITQILVSEEYRKYKVGKALLELCEAECVKEGFELLRLEVNNCNLNAIGFYLHHGFKRCEEKVTSFYMTKEIKMKRTINVTRSSMPDFEEYCSEIKELWDSRWLTNMGVKHKQLQTELEEYLNVPHTILYTNGHLALENVLAALNLPKRGEVITTPFTFVSTTHAIVRNGLVPVFCDVNDEDYTMDATKIEALITEKTVAIVPVHVYGNLCDVRAIKEIADKYGLKVIYDAAHAFGVTYEGVSAACFGDASMFSFHATKVFNTIEGGAICCSDDALVSVLNDMKNFGIRGPEECVYVGGNAKMSEFQAAMGICNLRHIEEEIAKRKMVVNQYRKRLSGVAGIKLCPEQAGVKSNYAYFPVVFDDFKYDRDEIFKLLKDHDIVARKYFYPLTNEVECYKGYPTAGVEKTPIAKYLADRVLTMPLYADMTLDEVNYISDIILK